MYNQRLLSASFVELCSRVHEIFGLKVDENTLCSKFEMNKLQNVLEIFNSCATTQSFSLIPVNLAAL